MLSLDPISLIQIAIIFVVSIVLHEYAHGYVSYKLGDPTPKIQGRLTWNPLAHLDLMGTLMIFLVGFGRAKPVQVNPSYYKDPLKGELLVSLAGPLSNLALATVTILLMVIIIVISGNGMNDMYLGSSSAIVSFLYLMAFINIILAVFNLIPLPPLDGYRIIKFSFPSFAIQLERYSRQFGIIFLLMLFLLIRAGGFKFISGVAEYIFNFIFHVFMSLFY